MIEKFYDPKLKIDQNKYTKIQEKIDNYQMTENCEVLVIEDILVAFIKMVGLEISIFAKSSENEVI